MKSFIYSILLLCYLFIIKEANSSNQERPHFVVEVGTDNLTQPWKQKTNFHGLIKDEKYVSGCHVNNAFRYVQDNFFSEKELEDLLKIVKRGMGDDLISGPTILDLNSGYRLNSKTGLKNIYEGEGKITFTKEELGVYKKMFDSIKRKIIEVNGLDSLYFTAPTFVARTVGDSHWSPKEPHDEYWHRHVDKENTNHYDYSGLVYLSDYGTDFEGGEFLFLDKTPAKAILPKKGRFITFASGPENPHQFLEVTKGTRFAFSMWFTCNPKMHFKTFLDGKAHKTELTNAAQRNDDDHSKDEL